MAKMNTSPRSKFAIPPQEVRTTASSWPSPLRSPNGEDEYFASFKVRHSAARGQNHCLVLAIALEIAVIDADDLEITFLIVYLALPSATGDTDGLFQAVG